MKRVKLLAPVYFTIYSMNRTFWIINHHIVYATIVYIAQYRLFQIIIVIVIMGLDNDSMFIYLCMEMGSRVVVGQKNSIYQYNRFGRMHIDMVCTTLQ